MGGISESRAQLLPWGGYWGGGGIPGNSGSTNDVRNRVFFAEIDRMLDITLAKYRKVLSEDLKKATGV